MRGRLSRSVAARMGLGDLVPGTGGPSRAGAVPAKVGRAVACLIFIPVGGILYLLIAWPLPSGLLGRAGLRRSRAGALDAGGGDPDHARRSARWPRMALTSWTGSSLARGTRVL